MCGRYTLYHDEEDLTQLFGLQDFPWRPRYNIAPTQLVPVVRGLPDHPWRERLDARWGLIPGWVKERSSFRTLLFNARSETVAEKPAFRDAARRGRCVLPASGFYEWQRGADGINRPSYVYRRDGAPLILAGLYATHEQEEPVNSTAILTTVPNAVMRPLHDRMPVVLDASDVERWLDVEHRDPTKLADLLRPCADDLLETHPVGRAVGNARIDEPTLVQRA